MEMIQCFMLNYYEVKTQIKFYSFSLSLSLVGDPPIKAIEFDGYMVLKTTLNGDKIPICRVEDLEITLVSPDLPVKIRLPTKSEHVWRSLSEVRAAEVQCMQLSLALLARHESEMYVTIEAEKNTTNYLQSNYNQKERTHKTQQTTDAIKKHLEECEEVFGYNTKSKIDDDKHSYNSREKHVIPSSRHLQKKHSIPYHESSSVEPSRIPKYDSSHSGSERSYRKSSHDELSDSYNHSLRTTGKSYPINSSSNNYKTKTNPVKKDETNK